MHLRAVLRGLRSLHGGWRKLAAALNLSHHTLEAIARGRSNGSPAVVLLAARAARTTVERVLTAGPADASICPHCGSRREVRT